MGFNHDIPSQPAESQIARLDEDNLHLSEPGVAKVDIDLLRLLRLQTERVHERLAASESRLAMARKALDMIANCSHDATAYDLQRIACEGLERTISP